MMKGVLSVNHRNNMAAINSTLHPGGQKQLERGTERERDGRGGGREIEVETETEQERDKWEEGGR